MEWELQDSRYWNRCLSRYARLGRRVVSRREGRRAAWSPLLSCCSLLRLPLPAFSASALTALAPMFVMLAP